MPQLERAPRGLTHDREDLLEQLVLVVKPSLDVADIKDQVHDREKKIPTWQLRLHTNTNAKGHTLTWADAIEGLKDGSLGPSLNAALGRQDGITYRLQSLLPPRVGPSQPRQGTVGAETAGSWRCA